MVNVRPLDVLFILFRIARWPSAGKKLFSWLSARVILILCRLNCICSFPILCLGQGVEFDYIGLYFDKTVSL